MAGGGGGRGTEGRASIPYGYRFEAWLLHFQSSCLLRSQGKQRKVEGISWPPHPLARPGRASRLLAPPRLSLGRCDLLGLGGGGPAGGRSVNSSKRNGTGVRSTTASPCHSCATVRPGKRALAWTSGVRPGERALRRGVPGPRPHLTDLTAAPRARPALTGPRGPGRGRGSGWG